MIKEDKKSVGLIKARVMWVKARKKAYHKK